MQYAPSPTVHIRYVLSLVSHGTELTAVSDIRTLRARIVGNASTVARAAWGPCIRFTRIVVLGLRHRRLISLCIPRPRGRTSPLPPHTSHCPRPQPSALPRPPTFESDLMSPPWKKLKLANGEAHVSQPHDATETNWNRDMSPPHDVSDPE